MKQETKSGIGLQKSIQEKDLKNAREFKISYQNFNMHRPVYQDMIQMLADYVQWLEQKGVIKFTGKREDVQEVHRDGSVEI